MVIPLRVQCSKDFVCNRRRHSSRSQRASLSLGIRFEADNVIVLRGESPQSSLGRASSSSCVYVCVSWKRRGKRFMPHIPNTYKQSHAGCEECYPHSMCKLKLRNSVRPNILALRGVSRSTGDETRQPADFNRVASLSLPESLSSSVYWRKAHGVRSVRVLSAVARIVVLVLLSRPWETRRAILVGSRELCGR